MKQNGRVNSLLVELLIVVLFFMLAATTLMEIFGAAKQNSTRAGVNSAALLQAQNMAERLYAADDMEAELTALGFVRGRGGWRLPCGEYDMIATYHNEPASAGVLREAELSAVYQGEVLFSLPATRYFSGEVSP